MVRSLVRHPVCVGALWLTVGCSGDEPAPTADSGAGTSSGAADASTGDSTGSTGGPSTAAIAVTADFLAQSLSIIDVAAIAAGAQTRDEALLGQVDLSAYTPGPLEVEVTPDGTLAVVAVSPGFFDGVVGIAFGITNVPLGGSLLIVDLASLEVDTELQPAHVPMGIAISPDGATAYTANYGHTDAPGTTVSIVDLATRTVVADVEVGARPEQVALDGTGALGLVNLAGDGTVRAFQTQDVAGTLSTPLAVSADPSDVAFIEGTDLAVVGNSMDPLNFTVIDVSDPAAPAKVADGPVISAFPYGTTPIAGTSEFLLTAATTEVVFERYDAAAPAAPIWSLAVAGVSGFPLGVAVDLDANLALSAVTGADALVVFNLDGTQPRAIPWLAGGPAYVALTVPPGR